ncbi:MAG: hypothetical protein NT001_03645 [Candidatus Woesearchaeota archaeon]|nr:hypothetical protein [Candidatus Woesearchaeota archaeon]
MGEIMRYLAGVAAAAALFGAGYTMGCAGAQDKDYKLMRETDKIGTEHVYLQDKSTIDRRIYEVMKEDGNVSLKPYKFEMNLERPEQATRQTNQNSTTQSKPAGGN